MKKSDVGKGLLSYLLGWLGALIVLLAMKNNTKRDIMNAGQGIVISVGNIILSGFAAIISQYVPFVSLGVYGLYIVILIFAIINVVGDKDPKLPIIGDITESLFGKQIAAAPEFVGTSQVKFDPNTGQPVNGGAKFDPNTGQPINSEAKFDPNTGQPVNGEVKFDPNTGQPVNGGHDTSSNLNQQSNESNNTNM